MMSRLFAGLIVSCAMLASAVAAEGDAPKTEPAEKPPLAAAPDGRKDEAPDPYDASWSPEKPATAKPGAEASPSKPDEAKKADIPAPAPKPVETAKPEQQANPGEAPKPTTPAEAKAADAPRKTDPNADRGAQPGAGKAAARREADAKPRAVANSRSTPPMASAAPAVTRPAKPVRASSTIRVGDEVPAETSARRRAASEPAGARPIRTVATESARPRFVNIPAVQRPATPPPAVMAAAQSSPIAGGILCGGGSKWRCNWLEKEHDKFYKFTKGHNWTDQTMSTDFCASEKQMRVASATRIKSVPGGCCGFVVVQVTCKR